MHNKTSRRSRQNGGSRIPYKILTALIFCLSAGSFSLVNAQTKAPGQAAKIVSKGIINGAAISLPKPQYPASSVKGSAVVKVQVTIDEAGNVIYAKAISGPAALRRPSEKDALQAKFQPTIQDGGPLKVSGVISYNFGVHNYEHEVVALGLGMVFNLPAMIAGDEDFFDNETLAGMIKDVPVIAKELAPLHLIKGQTPEDKAQTIASVAAKVEAKLTGTLAWQYAVGKKIAPVMAELIRAAKDENYRLDESSLRTELLDLKEFLKTAPADFPTPILDKLKEFAEPGDKEHPDPENDLKTIMSKFLELFDTILPGGK